MKRLNKYQISCKYPSSSHEESIRLRIRQKQIKNKSISCREDDRVIKQRARIMPTAEFICQQKQRNGNNYRR